MATQSPLLLAGQDIAKLERISVTGSSIKQIDAETSLPVQVFTQADIQRANITTAEELVNKISANSNGYNTAMAIGNSALSGLSSASLRGLGGSNTLILLNGRRMANYAFISSQTDLNALPMSAIERVEILKDGASAIYGSDAIGGVINFITKTDYTGATATGYKTGTAQVGGNKEQASLLWGVGNLDTDKFNFFANMDYQNSTAIHANDRDFAKASYIPSAGINKLSTAAYPANISFRGRLVNPGYSSGCAPPVSLAQNGRCLFDYAPTIDIAPPTERGNVYSKLTAQLGENHQAYLDYGYSYNKTTLVFSPTPVSSNVSYTGTRALYPVGGPFYPTGMGLSGDLNLFWRAVDAGNRVNETIGTTNRFILGMKGYLAHWDYDLALNHNKNEVTDSYTNGWLDESKLLPALYTGNINPFGSQTQTGLQLLQSAKILGKIRTATSEISSIDGKVSRDIMQLPAGPLAIALGGELRREAYVDTPSPVLSSGNVLGGPGSLHRQAGQRDVHAAFAELSIPLVKTLEAQLALRQDRYSDFGNTLNPKYSLKWTPSDELLVRGSFNTGFRAPSIYELYGPELTSRSANFHNDPLRCATTASASDCNRQMPVIYGGKTSLQPEKSRQWSLGIVTEPFSWVSLSADYFYIQRSNTIGNLSDDLIFANYAKYQSLFHRKPADAAFPALPGQIDYIDLRSDNLGAIRTSGVDISVSMKTPETKLGKLGLSLNGTRVLSYDYQLEKNGQWFDNLGRYAGAADGNGRGYRIIPAWRHYLALNWDYRNFSVTLGNNLTAGYVDANILGQGHHVASYSTWDVSTSYKGLKDLTLTTGIQNIFDTNPPFSNQGQTFHVGYDPKMADPRGLMFFGKIVYKFF